MSNAKPVAVNGTLFWASLQSKNELSGKFQVDVSNLSDAAVEALEGMGLPVRNKADDRNNFITCKSVNPIKAYDAHGEEVGSLVGNGSAATAMIGFFDWKFQQKAGRSPSLLKLKINDLVSYDPEGALPAESMEAAL
jgi:hypothetical protein|tara:strand:+ start:938 stop:1348 length:411 start_codon:yes stop_codon:yes gene_type:complete